MTGLKRQMTALDKFASDLVSGAAGSARRAAARARLYVNDAARRTYQDGKRRLALATGKTRERNVLHARESCSGCVAETARGWVNIGELVPIGQREPCGRFCKCSIAYQ